MDARRPPRPNESSLSEPNPTEFFICSTYLSGTPRSSCLFSPALLSMMNLRWPQKLRNGTDIGVLSAGAEDKTSEGGERERERNNQDSADEQLEKCRGEWGGGQRRGTERCRGHDDCTFTLVCRSSPVIFPTNLPNKRFPLFLVNMSIRKTYRSSIIAIRKSDITLLVGGIMQIFCDHKKMTIPARDYYH